MGGGLPSSSVSFSPSVVSLSRSSSRVMTPLPSVSKTCRGGEGEGEGDGEGDGEGEGEGGEGVRGERSGGVTVWRCE